MELHDSDLRLSPKYQRIITIMFVRREVWHRRIWRLSSGVLIKFQRRMADSHAHPFDFYQFVKLRRIFFRFILFIGFCRADGYFWRLRDPLSPQGGVIRRRTRLVLLSRLPHCMRGWAAWYEPLSIIWIDGKTL